MATSPAEVELDDSIFDAAIYRMAVPEADGYRASRLGVRLSGTGPLDRASADDLALGGRSHRHDVRLIFVASVSTKTYGLDSSGEELRVTISAPIRTVEAAELA
jgi:hypothetical protein